MIYLRLQGNTVDEGVSMMAKIYDNDKKHRKRESETITIVSFGAG